MGATEKISVTIGAEELRRAKRLAARLGLSLSTFISDAVKQRLEGQARKEAGLAVIATFGAEDRPTLDERATLLSTWGVAPKAAQRPKSARSKQRARRKSAVRRHAS